MRDKIKKILKMSIALAKYCYYSSTCRIKRIDNSDVWLISERGVDARDNGFHFYRYIKKNHPEVVVKYVISKDSADRKKIEKKDIIDYGSKKHYVLFKTAGALISTHVMGYSPDMSLFWRMDKEGLLKLNGKKIFLQHGITYSRVQSLDKRNSKIDLIMTAAWPEHKFIKTSYGYTDEEIKCVGFSRYDNLVDRSSSRDKKILIMPTFRKWLNYESDFKNSDYFKKWNGLLRSKSFVKFIDENNIQVYFYPHFEIQKNIKDFRVTSSRIKICKFDDYDVQDLLVKTNILITDYSSVQFDFAYMGKKVLYYQFDIERFYREHYEKGYFDFRKMGFGKVCIKEDELIKNLMNIESDKIFSKRREGFFNYRDSNNSKRVFDEIRKVIGERRGI